MTIAPEVEQQLKNHVSSQAAWLEGPLAGTLAALLSHPLDTVKTKQQTVLANRSYYFWQAAKDIVKTEGWFGLYKGCVPRSTRVISAVTLLHVAGKKWDSVLEAPKEDKGCKFK